MGRHRDDKHSAIPSGYYVEDMEFILNYYACTSARARYCRQRLVNPNVRLWRNTGNKKPCEIDLKMCGSRSWPAPQDDAHGRIVLIVYGICMDRHRDDEHSAIPSGYYVRDL